MLVVKLFRFESTQALSPRSQLRNLQLKNIKLSVECFLTIQQQLLFIEILVVASAKPL